MKLDRPNSPTTEGTVRLGDWGLISATGPDAASFLHGQLTQDVQSLDEGRARLAGYCTAKGRLLASFVAWRQAPEEILLACSADLLAPTLKRLSMYVLRARCKMADASERWMLHGLAGSAAAAWLGTAAAAPVWAVSRRDGAAIVRLPDAAGMSRWLLARPAEQAAPELPALSADTWRWLEVQSAVPRIVAATVEQFVPQMVNLELVGGVNFQKGCYPGQEIVARSQYRGTLKRRMQLLDATAPVLPGQDVFHSADPEQPAGQVVLAAPGPDGRWTALAELKLSALAEAGTLRCGDAQLVATALPYTIPLEAA